MSDDTAIDAHNANAGITLPGGVGATYNISLSPLFINRNGQLDLLASYSIGYGASGRFWSGTARSKSGAYLLAATTAPAPSDRYANVLGFSLRCLVSTN